MMQSLSEQRFIPQQGWEFKLDTDFEFINRYVICTRVICMYVCMYRISLNSGLA